MIDPEMYASQCDTSAILVTVTGSTGGRVEKKKKRDGLVDVSHLNLTEHYPPECKIKIFPSSIS